MKHPIRPWAKSRWFYMVCVGLVAFAGGLVFQRYKPPPYEVLRAAAGAIKQRLKGNTRAAGTSLASLYTRDLGPAEETRKIDTALLPLVARSYNIGATTPFPKGAGSLAIIEDTIAVFDWLGNAYVSNGGPLRKQPFPPIPNNVDAYISHNSKALNAGTLRLHDAQYLKESASLAVSHEQFDPATKLTHLAVSLISIEPLSVSPVGDWKTIFRTGPLRSDRYAGQAGGGRLSPKPPERLLLAVGDYNQDAVMTASPKVSQLAESYFGKILEINYRTGTANVVSIGHRNPQGLLVTDSGEIYSTEHGPAGGDELNRIVQGANYGWPEVTLGTDYGVYNWPLSKAPGSHAGYEMPQFAWLPSVGTSNLIQVKGFDDRWNGDLLIASLKAASLFRLRRHDGQVVYSEPIWIGHRIRDIAQLPTGTIVLWTDEARLLLVDIDRPKLEANRRGLGFIGQTELASCLSCHHFDITGPTHLAPTLTNIVGRKVASDSFTRYSPALQTKGGVWTPERLREFLSNPAQFAPGSTMPSLDLHPDVVAKIVDVLVNLAEQSNQPRREN